MVTSPARIPGAREGSRSSVARATSPSGSEARHSAGIPPRNAQVADGSVRADDSGRHAARLSKFARAREHQFRYAPGNYPDTASWSQNSMRDIKRMLGGGSSKELNCWGFVFYAHARTDNLRPQDLDARAAASRRDADAIENRLERDERYLLNIRHDLVGDAQSRPADETDFSRIPAGSTILFHPLGRVASHAGIMMDDGRIAHLIQSVTHSEAASRPDVANGQLELATPEQVLALVRGMPRGGEGVMVAHTNGPMHFVPPAN